VPALIKIYMGDNEKNWTREERRGLFVLGIMATLLAARDYYANLDIPFKKFQVPVTFFANIVLVFWGGYSFFMVFAIPGIFKNKSILRLSYMLSIIFLSFGSFYLICLTVLWFMFGFSEELPLIIIVISPLFILTTYYCYEKVVSLFRSKIKITRDKFFTGIHEAFTYLSAIGIASFFLSVFKVNTIPIISQYSTLQWAIISYLLSLIWVILTIFLDMNCIIERKKMQRNHI